MRRRRGALAVLSTLLLSLLAAGFAGSAVAGGPTSVLLVVPGEGRTAALYTGSADYEQLAALLDVYNTTTGSTTPPKTADDHGASGTNDASGPGVTLTWLMHDINVWRVDQVYPKAEGGPWIATQETLDGGVLGSDPPTWHRVGGAQAKALIRLLDRLGVGNTGARPHTDSAAQGVNVLPSTVAAAPIPAASGSKDSGGLPGPDGWIWGPAGVLLGLALALGVPAVRKRMTANGLEADSPDDDRIDAMHNEVEQPREVGQPRTETLSSHPPGR